MLSLPLLLSMLSQPREGEGEFNALFPHACCVYIFSQFMLLMCAVVYLWTCCLLVCDFWTHPAQTLTQKKHLLFNDSLGVLKMQAFTLWQFCAVCVCVWDVAIAVRWGLSKEVMCVGENNMQNQLRTCSIDHPINPTSVSCKSIYHNGSLLLSAVKVVQQQKAECSQKLEGLTMWLAGAASLLASQKKVGAESGDVNELQQRQKELQVSLSVPRSTLWRYTIILIVNECFSAWHYYRPYLIIVSHSHCYLIYLNYILIRFLLCFFTKCCNNTFTLWLAAVDRMCRKTWRPNKSLWWRPFVQWRSFWLSVGTAWVQRSGPTCRGRSPA